MTEVREVACYEATPSMDQATLAFQVRAVNLQAAELAAAYDVPVVPIRSYSSIAGLLGSFAAMAILDDIGEPGAAGFHDETAGLPWGRCKPGKDPNDATTLSHEYLELVRDPDINLWLPMPDGRRIAYEVCDPCQEERYAVPVTIGDETRWIWVSDFVLPAYWVHGAPGPYSRMDTIDQSFGVSKSGGGWRLIKDVDGGVSREYGPVPPNARLMAARDSDPGSRTYRRMNFYRPPNF